MLDKKSIEKATLDLLNAVGENSTREGLLETPKRVAKAYEEILLGYNQDAKDYLEKTFEHNGEDEILQSGIEFYSLCEHHLLPFYGKVNIAYIPNGKVVGLSKLSRVVDVFSKRLQLQERLTSQIAESISENLDCKGVLVYIEAEHMCMNMRGVKRAGTVTKTIVAKGIYKEDDKLRKNSLDMLGK